jgi:hypothetical protein
MKPVLTILLFAISLHGALTDFTVGWPTYDSTVSVYVAEDVTPHTLWVGKSIMFASWVRSHTGTPAGETATVTINGLPAGVTVYWWTCAERYSTVNTVPIDVLTSSGENAFILTASDSVVPGTYPITISYTANLSGIGSVVRTTPSYDLVIRAMPTSFTTTEYAAASRLSTTSLVKYFSGFDHFGKKGCNDPAQTASWGEQTVQYYDGARNYRKGRTMFPEQYDYYDACWITFSDNYITWTDNCEAYPSDNCVQGHHVFARGLYERIREDQPATHARTGLTNLLMNGGSYANYGVFAPVPGRYVASCFAGRDVAYALDVHIWNAITGNAPRVIAKEQKLLESVLGHWASWYDDQNCAYTQPLFVGLSANTLWDYYRYIEADPRIPYYLKKGADYIAANDLTVDNGVNYYDETGASTVSGSECPQCAGIIAPLYGIVYRLTGDVTYRNIGDNIFNRATTTCVAEGAQGCYEPKPYAQYMRWLDDYITLREPPTQYFTPQTHANPESTGVVAYFNSSDIGSSATATINGVSLGAATVTSHTKKTNGATETVGVARWSYGTGMTAQYYVTINRPYTYVVSYVAGTVTGETLKISSKHSTAPAETAYITAMDTITKGNWKTVYGQEGYKFFGGGDEPAQSLPAWVTSFTSSGCSGGTWAATTANEYALEKPAPSTDHYAGRWDTSNTFDSTCSITLTLTGGTHRVAIYFNDYNDAGGFGRRQAITLLDGDDSDKHLATRSLGNGALGTDTWTEFGTTGGRWFVFNLSGTKKIVIRNLYGFIPGVINGIFFGE